MEKSHDNWKLKLKYEKSVTPYEHFTILAEGIVAGELRDGYVCRPGNAFMSIKVWAVSSDVACEMTFWIAEQLGFQLTGRIEIFSTEPDEPSGDQPFIYQVGFQAFGNGSTPTSPIFSA